MISSNSEFGELSSESLLDCGSTYFALSKIFPFSWCGDGSFCSISCCLYKVSTSFNKGSLKIKV